MWQHLPEHIHPVLVSIGPLKIYYYGLSYLLAAYTVYALVLHRLHHEKAEFDPNILTYALPWVFLGMWCGARLLFVLTHWNQYYLNQPLAILLPFTWHNGLHYIGIHGMSSHGGLIGLAIAGWLFCRAHKLNYWKLGDLLAPCVPLGYTWGRIGNFINEDLYGRVTTVPWGMYFKTDPTHLRHPVQLYEAFFEGIVLFVLLWVIRKQKHRDGFLSALISSGIAPCASRWNISENPTSFISGSSRWVRSFALSPFCLY